MKAIKKIIEKSEFYQKHKNAIDQSLHVLMFFAIAYIASPMASLFCLCVRELAPKPWGQWPPGKLGMTLGPSVWNIGKPQLEHTSQSINVFRAGRVGDLRIDLVFSSVGIIVGGLVFLAWPWYKIESVVNFIGRIL